MSAVQSPLARKLGAFVALSEPELAALAVFHQRRRSFEPGVELVRQRQLGQLVYILAEGWVCSYKLLPNGTRQIVDFQVPGDFLGLRSVLLRTSDHNAEAMTQVAVSEVSSNDLIDVVLPHTIVISNGTFFSLKGCPELGCIGHHVQQY